MYTVENEALAVSVLDPLADQARFGTRYCTGGYIFQITDAQRGPLLTGPTYPDEFTPYNGQGLPDAFNLSPLRELHAPEHHFLILGVGLCDLGKDEVLEFCRWEVEQRADSLVMRTQQAWLSYGLRLERTVQLTGRTLRSATRVNNTGKASIPIRWYPHPFFPPPATPELCRFNLPVGMPENPGYRLALNGWVLKDGYPGTHGYYQPLDLGAEGRLIVLQKHPVLGLVVGTCSYVPSFIPIWGNAKTFSWEPFFERTLAAGQETTWWIDYDF